MAPRRTPAVTSPSGNPDGGLSIFTSTGFQSLTTQQYAKYANYLKPDITVALGDIPYGPMPGKKRAEKMADRTSMWVDKFLADLSKSNGSEAPDTAVFAPILTKDIFSQSEYLEHIGEDLTQSLAGLAFYSSSLLPEIPQTTALSRLVRLSLDEPSSPQEILRQISLGMDIFTIPFLGFATDSGLGLTFEFPRPSSTSESSTPAAEGTSVLPLATDLFNPSHSTSVTPLIDGCTCYACASHHRAYIHHLLNAKEMLAWTLLAIHNHHTASIFFSAVRKSIAAGTFEADKEIFERTYETELPESTGHKPRTRGYHFKSGAAEPKRNKPAWGALGQGTEGNVQTPLIVPDEDAKALDDKGFAEDLTDNPE